MLCWFCFLTLPFQLLKCGFEYCFGDWRGELCALIMKWDRFIYTSKGSVVLWARRLTRCFLPHGFLELFQRLGGRCRGLLSSTFSFVLSPLWCTLFTYLSSTAGFHLASLKKLSRDSFFALLASCEMKICFLKQQGCSAVWGWIPCFSLKEWLVCMHLIAGQLLLECPCTGAACFCCTQIGRDGIFIRCWCGLMHVGGQGGGRGTSSLSLNHLWTPTFRSDRTFSLVLQMLEDEGCRRGGYGVTEGVDKRCILQKWTESKEMRRH